MKYVAPIIYCLINVLHFYCMTQLNIRIYSIDYKCSNVYLDLKK